MFPSRRGKTKSCYKGARKKNVQGKATRQKAASSDDEDEGDEDEDQSGQVFHYGQLSRLWHSCFGEPGNGNARRSESLGMGVGVYRRVKKGTRREGKEGAVGWPYGSQDSEAPLILLAACGAKARN